MKDKTSHTLTAGGAIFPRLKALGVDYVFANSGTDFPPIIEGLAEADAQGEDLPQAVVIPHEHAAIGMAHGYYLISGKPQAVILHTNVGLANGASGAINAACGQVPMLLMSGRTPATEGGRFGSRNTPIGWGQEMRDQSALVRESCKWDNDLRYPEQVGPLLDRAHAIASSTPKGPVYLSLPREVLCETIPADGISAPTTVQPSVGAGDPAAIAQAAAWLADARNPLILAERGAGDAASFATFATWVADWGIAVSSWGATQLALPTDHPCNIGANPKDWLAEADVVLVLDALAPWVPDLHEPVPDARVITVGPDPIYNRFPTRTHRSDLTIAGELFRVLPALMSAMSELKPDQSQVAQRQARLAEISARQRSDMRKAIVAATAKGITKGWISHCLGTALDDRKASVFSELGAVLGPLERRDHNSWFQVPHSGGLGWSFPAAMGGKLAEPDRTCVATMGDGSYMFANPTACHQIAEALGLGIVVIIFNNEEWGAVRRSVKGLYPGGHATRANQMPLTTLKPVPDFIKSAEASRAWARRIDTPDAVLPAIEQALQVADTGRLALLDIATMPD